MTRYRLLFAGILLLSAFVFLESGQMVYGCMFLSLLALFHFLLIRMKMERKHLQVIACRYTRGIVGRKVFPQISVKTKSKSTIGRVYITALFHNRLTDQKLKKCVEFGWSNGVLCAIESWEFSDCGSVDVLLEKMEVFDIFGIHKIIIPCDQKMTFLIYPDEIAELSKKLEMDLHYQNYKNNKYAEEYGDIIPYEEGVPLSRIHWKLYGKFDELYLKNLEQDKNNKLLLVFEPNSIPAEQMTQAVQYLFAIGERLISEGKNYYVYLPIGNLNYFPVNNEQDYINMQEMLLASFTKHTRYRSGAEQENEAKLFQTIYKIQDIFRLES